MGCMQLYHNSNGAPDRQPDRSCYLCRAKWGIDADNPNWCKAPEKIDKNTGERSLVQQPFARELDQPCLVQ